jgi:hypothetical protein
VPSHSSPPPSAQQGQQTLKPPPASYSPFGSKPKAVESGPSYLSNLGGTVPPVQSHSSPPQSAEQGQQPLKPPPASYSPFGSKPKAVESGPSYLSNLGGTVPPVQSYSPPPPIQQEQQQVKPPPASYSPFGSKPKAVETGPTSYLSNLGGAASPVQTYSPPPLVHRSLKWSRRVLRT